MFPSQVPSLVLVVQTLFSFGSHSSQDKWVVRGLGAGDGGGDLVWVLSGEGRGQGMGDSRERTEESGDTRSGGSGPQAAWDGALGILKACNPPAPHLYCDYCSLYK